jgi:hypothetical protein
MSNLFQFHTSLTKTILAFTIASVWLINGLFCKVLNLVPRHQQIVGRILGEEYSRMATLAIGLSEILMAVWILSRIKSRICSFTQVFIVALMNIIEFILVPDLLLFGKINSIVAAAFIVLLLINELFIPEGNEKMVA